MNIPDAATVFAYVRQHPSVTCAQIARELDAPAVMVSASLRALRAAGKLRSTGNTKATKWRPTPKWR
jgi:hypothetical protein